MLWFFFFVSCHFPWDALCWRRQCLWSLRSLTSPCQVWLWGRVWVHCYRGWFAVARLSGARYLKIVEKSGYQAPPWDIHQIIKLSRRTLRIFESPNSVTDLYSKRFSQALPWVRYITQNGDYQLRMAWVQVDNTSLFHVLLEAPRIGFATVQNHAVDMMIRDDNCGEESTSRFTSRCRGRFGFGLSTCSAFCIWMFSLPELCVSFTIPKCSVNVHFTFQDAPMAALARFGCTAVADISCQCRVQNLAQPWGKNDVS